MKVRGKHKYNHDVDTVYAVLTDTDFTLEKYAALGAREIELIDSEQTDTALTFQTHREVPSDVPAVLKSFLGDWNSVLQTEEWEGDPGDEYYADFRVEPDGVPVKIVGTMNLSADGDGSVNDIELEITCGIPLVGRKLAEFVAKDAERNMLAEYEFAKEYLDRQD